MPPPKYQVFISYNRKDTALIEPLVHRLRSEAKLKVFVDEHDLQTGAAWTEALAEALENSGCVAVCIGPSGLGPWQRAEAGKAFDDMVQSAGLRRVFAVLLPGASDAMVDPWLHTRSWVDFRRPAGIADPGSFRRLISGILGTAPEATEESPQKKDPPYRGLKRFERSDAKIFFGRDQQIREALELIKRTALTAIIGASGSGKSSLARAGVVPRWATPTSPTGLEGLTFIMRPGATPLRVLADELAALFPAHERLGRANQAFAELEQRDDALLSLLRLWFPGRKLLLVIDQFEEILTHGNNEDGTKSKRSRFLANVLHAARHGEGGLHILITLRADFVEFCKPHRELCEWLTRPQLLLVGDLGEAGLIETIMRPAQVAGIFFEVGLPQRIIADFRNSPGTLPLLEDALLALWQRRHGDWMTHEAYDDPQTGGIRGALTRRANTVFAQLADRDMADFSGNIEVSASQAVARHIFVRLTSLAEGAPATRRRVLKRELYPTGLATSEVEKVIEHLAQEDARLIVVDGEFVEIAHEILIEEWPLLQSWLREARRAERIGRDLTDRTNRWIEDGRKPEYVFRGSQLLAAEEWEQQHPEKLNDEEAQFLRFSRKIAGDEAAERLAALERIAAAEQQAAAERLAALERIAAAERQTAAERLASADDRAHAAAHLAVANRRTAWWLTIALGVFLTAAVAVALLTWRSTKASQEKLKAQIAAKETEREVAVERERASRLESESVQTALRRAEQLVGDEKPQEALAKLVTTCRLYPKNSLAATSLLSMLSAKAWPMALTAPISGPKGPIERARFSSDGRRLITTVLGSETEPSTASVWDAATGQRVLQAAPCDTRGTNEDNFVPLPDESWFSRDGRYLALTTGMELTLWDLVDAKKVGGDAGSKITALQFSLDDSTLVAGTESGLTTAWSTEMKVRWRLQLEGGVVAFSRDGKWALARLRGTLGKIQLYNIDGANTDKRTGVKHGKPFSADRIAAWDHGLTQVVVVEKTDDNGEEFRLVKVREPQSAATELKKGWGGAVDFARDGASFAVVGRATDADLEHERAVVEVFVKGKLARDFKHRIIDLQTFDGFYPYDVRFSPGAPLLASVAVDGRVYVHDLSRNPSESIVLKGTEDFTTVDFSPDGRQLLTGRGDGKWQIFGLAEKTELPGVETTLSVETDPKPTFSIGDHGRVLAMQTQDGVTIREIESGKTLPRRDLSSFRKLDPDLAETDQTNSDGTRLLSVGTPCVLSDPRDGRVIRDNINLHGFTRFSPSGKWFLTAQKVVPAGSIQFWNSETGYPLGEAITFAGVPESAGFSAEGEFAWVWDSVSNGGLSIIDIASGCVVMPSRAFPGLVAAWISQGVVSVISHRDGKIIHTRLPFGLENTPPLMCELAEAIAARRMNPTGVVDELPITHDTFVTLANQVRATEEGNPFLVWARRFLLERERSVAKP